MGVTTKGQARFSGRALLRRALGDRSRYGFAEPGGSSGPRLSGSHAGGGGDARRGKAGGRSDLREGLPRARCRKPEGSRRPLARPFRRGGRQRRGAACGGVGRAPGAGPARALARLLLRGLACGRHRYPARRDAGQELDAKRLRGFAAPRPRTSQRSLLARDAKDRARTDGAAERPGAGRDPRPQAPAARVSSPPSPSTMRPRRARSTGRSSRSSSARTPTRAPMRSWRCSTRATPPHRSPTREVAGLEVAVRKSHLGPSTRSLYREFRTDPVLSADDRATDWAFAAASRAFPEAPGTLYLRAKASELAGTPALLPASPRFSSEWVTSSWARSRCVRISSAVSSSSEARSCAATTRPSSAAAPSVRTGGRSIGRGQGALGLPRRLAAPVAATRAPDAFGRGRSRALP